MLFTIFSVLTLAAIGRAAPAPAELEERSLKSKYHCTTKYAGILSSGQGGSFQFTQSGSLVTYTGPHPKAALNVEFQACSDPKGHIVQESGDWVGRLRIKGTNSCIDLSTKTSSGAGLSPTWLPKIATCNGKKLTPGQTWRYEPSQSGLFWGGWFYFGETSSEDGEVCRGGYKSNANGTPLVNKKKQIQVTCAADDDTNVDFWELT